MEATATNIKGLVLIQNRYIGDSRGRFSELYKESAFWSEGITDRFMQDNTSFSKKGVLRGLHFQLYPFQQSKLVYCLSGRIFDVAVDLRAESPTYLKHYAIDLTNDGTGLYLPKGMAHGFYAYEPSIILYKCDMEYSPKHEGGIRWDDPKLNIPWPKGEKRVSDKDNALPFLKHK